MTQTALAFAKSLYKVEVSAAGAVWTDISGEGATVTVDGGEIPTGAQHTPNSPYAVVVTSNKIGPRTLTVRGLFTESATEGFGVVWGQFTATAKTLFVRYSPAGGTATTYNFTTSNDGATAAAGKLVSCSLPDGDANSGDPMMFEFSVITPALLRAVIT
jgi:hypothetical protein